MIKFENLPSTNTPINAENLNKINEIHFIPSMIGPNQGWYLCASGQVTDSNNNHTILLSITQGFYGKSGIIYLNIRKDSTDTYITCFEWLVNNGIPNDVFKLQTDNQGNYYLYAKTTYAYQKYGIQVMQSYQLSDYGKPTITDFLTFNEPKHYDMIDEPEGTFIQPYDTGWVNCQLAADVSTIEWNPLQYRRIGKTVQIRGTVILNNTEWAKNIAVNLPYARGENDFICRGSQGAKAHIIGLTDNGYLNYLFPIEGDYTNVEFFVSATYFTD